MSVLRDRHGIIVNVKDDKLRLSMNFFNNEEDIEKVVRAIARETGGKATAAWQT
jgi:selenocysteine lyase/cysteine desulfurase